MSSEKSIAPSPVMARISSDEIEARMIIFNANDGLFIVLSIPMGFPMNDRLISRKWSLGTLSLMVPPVVVALLVGQTLRHRDWNEPFFVNSAYFILCTMLGVYLVVLLSGYGEAWSPRAWIRENVLGIVTTAAVSTTVLCSVAPAFRVLADEANLVGVSKNLFFYKTANFAVTGKWYFENYWNINLTTDRRPALFPFLVSLIHTVRGYHAENAFHLNAIIFILFVYSSYRLAKSLGGEVFGVAAAILFASSPNTLVSTRSGGFDLLAAFLLLVVIQRFYAYVKQPSPRGLALLSLSLCFLIHVRVESMGLAAVATIALLSLGVVKWSHFRGFGFVYSLTPVFLVSRYWQSVAKAHDTEQPLSASMFGKSYFFHNLRDYVGLLANPLQFDGPHSRLLMICGAAGGVLVAYHLVVQVRARGLSPAHLQLAVFVGALVAAEFVVSFAYSFGQASQPASARIFIWLDTLLAFLAAWLLTVVGGRLAVLLETMRGRAQAAITTFACGAIFAMHVPVASDARFVNALIVTRQAAVVWRFFAQLGQKSILVLTDRPGLYTIMDYGARDISVATSDRNCLYELSRHLYSDIYLVQELDLETKQPRPGFTAWPDVATEPVLEFQTTDSTFVRVARVTH
jgi:hypothetical protein